MVIKANPKTLLMCGSLVLSLKVLGLECHFSRGGSEQEQGCGGLGRATWVKSLMNFQAVVPLDRPQRSQANQSQVPCKAAREQGIWKWL